MTVNNKKSNILLKTVALVVACAFFINNIAYAAPPERGATNLAVPSRFKPFFDAHGLGFQDLAAVTYATEQLRDLISSGTLRKSHIMNLNKLFSPEEVFIDPNIGERKFSSTQRHYKYATFYFGKEKKPIEVRFVDDHGSLTGGELLELGVRTEKDREYFSAADLINILPKLEGIWFVDPDRPEREDQGDQSVGQTEEVEEKTSGIVSSESDPEHFRGPAPADTGMWDGLSRAAGAGMSLGHKFLAPDHGPSGGPSKNPKKLVRKAKSLMSDGKYRDAAGILARASEEYPHNSHIATLRVKNLSKLRYFSEAVALGKKYIGKFPDDPAPYNTLANIYLDMGRVGDARKIQETALERFPESIVVITTLANIYMRAGKPQKAVALIEKPLRNVKPDVFLMTTIANAYLQLGRSEDAIELARKAVGRYQDDGRAANTLVNAYLQAERFEEAIREGESAVRKFPRNVVVRTTLANVYLQRGMAEKAIAVARRAVSEFPRDAVVLTTLIQSYLRAGDLDAARTAAEKGLVRFPRDLILKETAAMVHLVAGDVAEAGRVNGPETLIRAASHLARTYIFWDLADDAEQTMRLCLELFEKWIPENRTNNYVMNDVSATVVKLLRHFLDRSAEPAYAAKLLEWLSVSSSLFREYKGDISSQTRSRYAALVKDVRRESGERPSSSSPAFFPMAGGAASALLGNVFVAVFTYLYLSSQKKAIVEFLQAKSFLGAWYSPAARFAAFFAKTFLINISLPAPGLTIQPVSGIPENSASSYPAFGENLDLLVMRAIDLYKETNPNSRMITWLDYALTTSSRNPIAVLLKGLRVREGFEKILSPEEVRARGYAGMCRVMEDHGKIIVRVSSQDPEFVFSGGAVYGFATIEKEAPTAETILIVHEKILSELKKRPPPGQTAESFLKILVDYLAESYAYLKDHPGSVFLSDNPDAAVLFDFIRGMEQTTSPEKVDIPDPDVLPDTDVARQPEVLPDLEELTRSEVYPEAETASAAEPESEKAVTDGAAMDPVREVVPEEAAAATVRPEIDWKELYGYDAAQVEQGALDGVAQPEPSKTFLIASLLSLFLEAQVPADTYRIYFGRAGWLYLLDDAKAKLRGKPGADADILPVDSESCPLDPYFDFTELINAVLAEMEQAGESGQEHFYKRLKSGFDGLMEKPEFKTFVMSAAKSLDALDIKSRGRVTLVDTDQFGSIGNLYKMIINSLYQSVDAEVVLVNMPRKGSLSGVPYYNVSAWPEEIRKYAEQGLLGEANASGMRLRVIFNHLTRELSRPFKYDKEQDDFVPSPDEERKKWVRERNEFYRAAEAFVSRKPEGNDPQGTIHNSAPAFLMAGGAAGATLAGNIFMGVFTYLYLSSQKKAIVGFLQEKSSLGAWYSPVAGAIEFLAQNLLFDMSRFAATRYIARSFVCGPRLMKRRVDPEVSGFGDSLSRKTREARTLNTVSPNLSLEFSRAQDNKWTQKGWLISETKDIGEIAGMKPYELGAFISKKLRIPFWDGYLFALEYLRKCASKFVGEDRAERTSARIHQEFEAIREREQKKLTGGFAYDRVILGMAVVWIVSFGLAFCFGPDIIALIESLAPQFTSFIESPRYLSVPIGATVSFPRATGVAGLFASVVLLAQGHGEAEDIDGKRSTASRDRKVSDGKFSRAVLVRVLLSLAGREEIEGLSVPQTARRIGVPLNALYRYLQEHPSEISYYGIEMHRKNKWFTLTRPEMGEAIRTAIAKYRPGIIFQYQRIDRLSEAQKRSLADDIYAISQGLFHLWGIGASISPVYQHKSHIDVLKSAFPQLDLETLGFGLTWKTPEERLASVRYVVSRNMPHLMERYDKLDETDTEAVRELQDEFYKIRAYHLATWGAGDLWYKEVAPEFEGRYARALALSFPKLKLNDLGFEGDWTSPERAVETLRFALSRKIPDIIARYERIEELTSDEVDALRRDILAIRSGHFVSWGLAYPLLKKAVPHFEGSYIKALLSVFSHPALRLTEQDFRDPARLHSSVRYRWDTIEGGVANIRNAIKRHVPSIIERYDILDELDDDGRDVLMDEIYALGMGHFSAWGLGRALKVKYFKGSYKDALIATFPKLDLNRLGFEMEVDTPENRRASIEYVVMRHRPDLLERYWNRSALTDEDLDALRRDVYRIKQAELRLWGLSSLLTKSVAPEIDGRAVNLWRIIMPELGLDDLGFRLDYSTPERAASSVRFVVFREMPFIKDRYTRISELNDDELDVLRKDIYSITEAHFRAWQLNQVLHKNKVKGYGGRYSAALVSAFDDPRLDLREDRFIRRILELSDMSNIETILPEDVLREYIPMVETIAFEFEAKDTSDRSSAFYIKGALEGLLEAYKSGEYELPGFSSSAAKAMRDRLALIIGEAKASEKKRKEAHRRRGAGEAGGVKQYMRDIQRVELLSADEEIALARRIKDGDEEAFTRFIQANLRLVVSVARKYSRDENRLMDLVQEGNIGLMRAVEKWEYERGYKFSTYAVWWIHQSIIRSMTDKTRTIRLPEHVQSQVNRLNKVSARLVQEFGREPNEEEIAERMEVSVDKVKKLLSIPGAYASLDSNVGDDGTTLGDFIAADDLSHESLVDDDLVIQFAERIKDEIRLKFSRRRTQEVFIKILEMRVMPQFGIGQERSLYDIGKALGLSHERVRQVEARIKHICKHVIAREGDRYGLSRSSDTKNTQTSAILMAGGAAGTTLAENIFMGVLMYLHLSSQKKAIVEFLQAKSGLGQWYSPVAGAIEFLAQNLLFDMSRFAVTRYIARSLLSPGLTIRPIGPETVDDGERSGSGIRLAEHIRARTGIEPVEIDAQSPQKIIALLRKGQTVAISFDGLRGSRGDYSPIMKALDHIQDEMDEVFPHPPYLIDTGRLTKEILKNAFVHGNKLELGLPVFIRLENMDGLDVLEVYDVASGKKPSKKDMLAARHASLYGAGIGERSWLSSEQYKRQEIRDESGTVIGMVASLVLNPNRWEDPLEASPDIIEARTLERGESAPSADSDAVMGRGVGDSHAGNLDKPEKAPGQEEKVESGEKSAEALGENAKISGIVHRVTDDGATISVTKEKPAEMRGKLPDEDGKKDSFTRYVEEIMSRKKHPNKKPGTKDLRRDAFEYLEALFGREKLKEAYDREPVLFKDLMGGIADLTLARFTRLVELVGKDSIGGYMATDIDGMDISIHSVYSADIFYGSHDEFFSVIRPVVEECGTLLDPSRANDDLRIKMAEDLLREAAAMSDKEFLNSEQREVLLRKYLLAVLAVYYSISSFISEDEYQSIAVKILTNSRIGEDVEGANATLSFSPESLSRLERPPSAKIFTLAHEIAHNFWAHYIDPCILEFMSDVGAAAIFESLGWHEDIRRIQGMMLIYPRAAVIKENDMSTASDRELGMGHTSARAQLEWIIGASREHPVSWGKLLNSGAILARGEDSERDFGIFVRKCLSAYAGVEIDADSLEGKENVLAGTEEIKHILGKGRVARKSIENVEVAAVAQELDMLHNENLKFTPTIQQKTILCHIVTDSILPPAQRNMLKRIEQGMRGNEYKEKIVSLSIDEMASPDEYIRELERLKDRIIRQYEGYNVEFTVACSDKEGLVQRLRDLDMNALAFAREGEGEIVQVEGILLALRALHAGNVDALLHVYRMLTGKDMGAAPRDINQLARVMLFILPVRKIDLDSARDINELIRKNILTAA